MAVTVLRHQGRRAVVAAGSCPPRWAWSGRSRAGCPTVVEATATRDRPVDRTNERDANCAVSGAPALMPPPTGAGRMPRRANIRSAATTHACALSAVELDAKTAPGCAGPIVTTYPLLEVSDVVAREVIEKLIDDVDGSEAGETITFGLDGDSYEIDLNKKNAAALRKALGPFVAAARRSSEALNSPRRRAASAAKSKPVTREYDIVRLRQWAGTTACSCRHVDGSRTPRSSSTRPPAANRTTTAL